MAGAILIVDDDPDMRELLRAYVAGAGYEVHLAPDALAASHMLLKVTPDLLICDVHMPYVDGFEFVATLRTDATLANIPVIFLTCEEEGHCRAGSLHAVGYITKPVRRERLLSLLQAHLPRQKYAAG